MSEDIRQSLWGDFLARWPLETVRNMKLEEYIQLGSDDTFTAWVDLKLRSLGAFTGNPNFQFALFQMLASDEKPANATWIYQGGYAWFKNYGATLDAAFKTIRERIVQIIEAVQARNLTILDPLYFPAQMMWKVAFLYQERTQPLVLPIYQLSILDYYGDQLEPGAPPRNLELSVLHPRLIQEYQQLGDPFAIADFLRKGYLKQEPVQVSHWVIPLKNILPETEARTAFLNRREVGPGDIPAGLLPGTSGNLEVKSGDWLVFLDGYKIGAFAQLTDGSSGAEAWKQFPVTMDWPLNPFPNAPRKLDAREWRLLEDQMPSFSRQIVEPQSKPLEADSDISPAESYWKISPGHNAVEWPQWRDQKYIAMGWDLYGDLTECSEAAFWQRAQAAEAKAPDYYNNFTARKVWQFRHFPVGARIVANQGFHTALGFGTVSGPYFYKAGDHYPHRLPIRWDDIRPRKIYQRAYFQTLLRLDATKYKMLLESPLRDVTEPPIVDPPEEGPGDNNMGKSPRAIEPCNPQNIILYGPPGVGKTYQSIEQALLLAGEEVPDDPPARQKLFAELQQKGRIEFITFHQSYGYEEFVEGLRPMLGQDGQVHYEMHLGVFKRIALRAMNDGLPQPVADALVQDALDAYRPDGHLFLFSADLPQYVLIIDEINRGNISKILGELITLLEPDKRLGSPATELVLRLSSSPEHRFAVPPNLHILGTMNTADRSIALMDVALRRRFQFQEMLPKSSVILEQLTKRQAQMPFVSMVVDLFETLNARIRFLFDRDHQLGHAYFLKAKDPAGLRLTLVDRVIPLLQEYFHGAWEKLCMVLGCPYEMRTGTARRNTPEVNGKSYRFPCISVQRQDETRVLGFNHQDYEDHIDFTVEPRLMSGETPDVDLLHCFLGILDDEGYEKHRSLLNAPAVEPSSAANDGAQT